MLYLHLFENFFYKFAEISSEDFHYNKNEFSEINPEDFNLLKRLVEKKIPEIVIEKGLEGKKPVIKISHPDIKYFSIKIFTNVNIFYIQSFDTSHKRGKIEAEFNFYKLIDIGEVINFIKIRFNLAKDFQNKS